MLTIKQKGTKMSHPKFYNKINASSHSRREFMFIGQFNEKCTESRRDCMFFCQILPIIPSEF
jgi:hypothetical protein